MTSTIASTSGLLDYLRACDGCDVLEFPSSAAATEAARGLRERFPEIEVRASYDKVRLTIPSADPALVEDPDPS